MLDNSAAYDALVAYEEEQSYLDNHVAWLRNLLESVEKSAETLDT